MSFRGQLYAAVERLFGKFSIKAVSIAIKV